MIDSIPGLLIINILLQFTFGSYVVSLAEILTSKIFLGNNQIDLSNSNP
jgi:hypothetical protein